MDQSAFLIDVFIARVRAGERNPFVPPFQGMVQQIHAHARNPRHEPLVRRGLWLCPECQADRIDAYDPLGACEVHCDEGHPMRFQGPVEILASEATA